MKYRKVFSATRFHSANAVALSANLKEKSVLVGSRSGHPTTKMAFLGKVIEQGRTSNFLDYSVMCDVTFPHVIGIFGSRGSGKSFDLGLFVEGIFVSDDEVTDACVIFDVQDQFWTLSHEPSPELPSDEEQLLELAKWGLSPGHLDGVHVYLPRNSTTPIPGAIPFSLAATQLSSDDWLAILDLERFSAMGQTLLSLLAAVGPLPPDALSQACVSGATLSAFQQGSIDGVKWRLDGLAASGIVADTGVAVDDLLRPGTLSVMLMRNLSEAERGLVVGVISRLVADRMGRIQQARKVAARTGGGAKNDAAGLTNRLWLVLDEAHVLVPSDGSTAATAPLIDYVKRGRDAGLSLIFATQQPSAVNSKLLSQLDLAIVHTLGFESDLSAAIARMPTRTSVDYEIDNHRVPSLSDVIRSLAPGEAVIADTSTSRAFLARMRPRLTAHGGTTPR